MFLGSSLAVRQSGSTVAPPCLGLPWPPQSQLCTTSRASTAPNYRVLPPRDLLLVASLPKTWFEVSAAGDLGSGMGPPRSRRPANEEGQACCHLSCRHPSALQSHRQSEQTTLRKQFPSELCGLVSQVRKRCGGARVLSFTGPGHWLLQQSALPASHGVGPHCAQSSQFLGTPPLELVPEDYGQKQGNTFWKSWHMPYLRPGFPTPTVAPCNMT